ncbi:DUF6538 domain-containing protein [Azovibrio restrictus]|uniref:DUF6538 domain-containing protein n=1 Tax=Azovibrio restrictus TaxID=146938 RepID=UPI00350E53E5
MGKKVPKPWCDPASGIYYTNFRVPTDLVPLVGRPLIQKSLRTKERRTARRRAASSASTGRRTSGCSSMSRARASSMAVCGDLTAPLPGPCARSG